jgi:hypothetical protein
MTCIQYSILDIPVYPVLRATNPYVPQLGPPVEGGVLSGIAMPARGHGEGQKRIGWEGAAFGRGVLAA